MITQLRKLFSSLRPTTPPPQPARVEANERGLRNLQAHDLAELAWDDIMSIKITWSENPWGDPFCGPYCDTDWVIKGSNGNPMWIWDEEQNREVMLPAFEKRLPGFQFDYAAFDEQHKGRFSDLDGGEVILWTRQ